MASWRREPLGQLRGRVLTVLADDGVPLHAEIDGPDDAPVTIIFCHGYVLSQDVWHYQRRDLAPAGRLVFWDQRGHGRSGQSSPEHARISQLGADLYAVLMAAAPGQAPVVLVGHSMGGMTIMALARQHPELFGTKVIGAVLISTAVWAVDPTAWVPAPLRPIARLATPPVLRGASKARPAVLVERGRQVGGDLAFLGTRFIAFGDPSVSPAIVDFLERIVRVTPVGVGGNPRLGAGPRTRSGPCRNPGAAGCRQRRDHRDARADRGRRRAARALGVARAGGQEDERGGKSAGGDTGAYGSPDARPRAAAGGAAAGRRPAGAQRTSRGGEDHARAGDRRRAGRARSGDLAHVRHRAYAPVDGRRARARARGRLPARQPGGGRRSRPGRRPGQLGDRRGVGRGSRRGPRAQLPGDRDRHGPARNAPRRARRVPHRPAGRPGESRSVLTATVRTTRPRCSR